MAHFHQPARHGILHRGKSREKEEAGMPATIEALGIDRLSVRERLDLIEQIWSSLPEQIDPSEVPAWHLDELARRRAEAEARPGGGKPWREVLGSFEAKP